MTFTSVIYCVFFFVVWAAYWLVRRKAWQNALLLVASYVFYGWVTPWFCILLAGSTVLDYVCGWVMGQSSVMRTRRVALVASLCGNLGLLGTFKYFDFFAANVAAALQAMGLKADPVTLGVVLPVGISFYTFQTLTYSIDIYRRQIEPRRSFIDFALFVSFFPQLVAGPIERAAELLPQIERERRLEITRLLSAVPLIVRGYFVKLVVADNVGQFATGVYMLKEPSLWVLFAGTVAFAVQILADFSAYTDIARGSSRLLGFELMENFNAPYLATSPSDFWRRWHISFSTWIRDYLYIPLGGSKGSGRVHMLLVLLATMGLSGLWHGAQWHFVFWGLYHGVVLWLYRQCGFAGRWAPRRGWRWMAAVAVMWVVTLVGWAIFRTSNMAWLTHAVRSGYIGLDGEELITGGVILMSVIAFAWPWMLGRLFRDVWPRAYWLHAAYDWMLLAMLFLFASRDPQQFIYFQF